jgi:hypothetical protein
MNDNDEKEHISIKDAFYNFIKALSTVTELDKTKDTVKISLYNRHNYIDTITYKHNTDFSHCYCFQGDNEKNQPIIYSSNEPGLILSCKLLDKEIDIDANKENYFFLMRSESPKTIDNITVTCIN